MASQSYLIMQGAVSRERLRELSVRVVREETLEFTVSLLPATIIPCYVITSAGLRKLAAAGFDTTIGVESGIEDLLFVGLANPDGSPAITGEDPQLIRKISFSGMPLDTELREFLRQQIKEYIVPVWKWDVILNSSAYAETNGAVETEGLLKIFLHSSPTNGEWHAPALAWGNEVVDSNVTCLGVWAAGDPIRSTEGFEMGAYNDSNVYLYWNVLLNDTPEAREIFTEFLKETARLRLGGEPIISVDVVRTNYVTACSQRQIVQLRNLDREVLVAIEEGKNHRAKLVESVRKHRRALNDIEQLHRSAADGEEKLAKEFTALLAIPKVISIDWRADFMVVRTDVLYCIHPTTGDEYEIGAFKLLIDRQNAEVQFWNLTRRVQGYEANMNGPHLFSDGRACLGNMSDTIPQLVGQYEWSAAVQVCIGFIESVNLDDAAGAHITKWPKSRTKARIELDKLKAQEAIQQTEVADQVVPQVEAGNQAALDALAILVEVDAV